MSAEDALGPQFHDIKASDLAVGHLLGSSRKTRVARVMARNGRILAQTKTRGAGGSVSSWDENDTVRVWDPKPKAPLE